MIAVLVLLASWCELKLILAGFSDTYSHRLPEPSLHRSSCRKHDDVC